jgi:ribose transport system ATP-binding protein
MTSAVPSPPTLRLERIEKSFPGVRALKDVSFEVRAGEVHALLGENGAGKSTLMAVAAGALAPDAGSVEIGGRRLQHAHPATAQSYGLTVVYQHSSVLDDLSVIENLLLALPESRRPPVREAERFARRHLDAIGADIDPRARASELSVAQRQLLEIAKALALEAKVLVLDEPTESLTAKESERLFEQIAKLREMGSSVVYISHRLPEVRRVADRITVLRDGESQGTFDISSVDDAELLRRIVGRPVQQTFPEKASSHTEQVVLDVASLAGHRLAGASFSVTGGEILGLAGVEGNGQREALRAVAGLAHHRGQVTVRGESADTRTPRRARRSGILYLPRDRHREGLLGAMSVRENLSLLVLREIARGGFLRQAREASLAREQIRSFAIKTGSAETAVATLSGGNQQKVVIARTLLAEPAVLLADDPTRGVDVGARIEIYRLLRQIADRGGAVVVASADAHELQGLCDRVLVFSRGRVVRELNGPEVSEDAITTAAVTANVRHDTSERTARPRRLARVSRSDLAPSSVLALLIVALAAVTGIGHPLFLSARSMSGMLFLAAASMLVSFGQLVALVAGSFDLSVGPLMGLTVVVLSFFATSGAGYGGFAVGALVALCVGAGVGLVNAGLIRTLRLGPVISTLVTYTALQGISLLLRPQPAGSLDFSVTSGIEQSFGALPVVFVVVVVLAIAAELWLRRRPGGRSLRAVGSDEVRAFRVGAPVTRTLVLAQVVCSLFAVAAGILLAAQVGIGDPTLGTDYTLTSLAAAVLGGASIFGGRGSFVGALLGALLLQEITTATAFLGLPQAWQQWLPGALILLGAGIYSKMRTARGANAAGMAA